MIPEHFRPPSSSDAGSSSSNSNTRNRGGRSSRVVKKHPYLDAQQQHTGSKKKRSIRYNDNNMTHELTASSMMGRPPATSTTSVKAIIESRKRRPDTPPLRLIQNSSPSMKPFARTASAHDEEEFDTDIDDNPRSLKRRNVGSATMDANTLARDDADDDCRLHAVLDEAEEEAWRRRKEEDRKRLLRYSYETPFLVDHTCRLVLNTITADGDDCAFVPSEKAAFLGALERAPQYLIEEESNPIDFLRYENFNIHNAAKRLLSYWTLRQTLFEDRTYLPLLPLTGRGALNACDIALFVQTGCIFPVSVNEKNGKDGKYILVEDASTLLSPVSSKSEGNCCSDTDVVPTTAAAGTTMLLQFQQAATQGRSEPQQQQQQQHFMMDEIDEFELHCSRERIRFYMLSLVALNQLPLLFPEQHQQERSLRQQREKDSGHHPLPPPTVGSSRIGTPTTQPLKHPPQIDYVMHVPDPDIYRQWYQEQEQEVRPRCMMHLKREDEEQSQQLLPSPIKSLSLMARILPLSLASVHVVRCTNNKNGKNHQHARHEQRNNSNKLSTCNTDDELEEEYNWVHDFRPSNRRTGATAAADTTSSTSCYFHQAKSPEDILDTMRCASQRGTNELPTENQANIERAYAAAATSDRVSAARNLLSKDPPPSLSTLWDGWMTQHQRKQRITLGKLVLQHERSERHEILEQHKLILLKADKKEKLKKQRKKRKRLQELIAEEKHERDQVEKAKGIFLMLAGLNLNLEEENKALTSRIGEINQLIALFQQQQHQLATMQAGAANLSDIQLVRLIAEILLFGKILSEISNNDTANNSNVDYEQLQELMRAHAAVNPSQLAENAALAAAAAAAQPPVAQLNAQPPGNVQQQIQEAAPAAANNNEAALASSSEAAAKFNLNLFLLWQALKSAG